MDLPRAASAPRVACLRPDAFAMVLEHRSREPGLVKAVGDELGRFFGRVSDAEDGDGHRLEQVPPMRVSMVEVR